MHWQLQGLLRIAASLSHTVRVPSAEELFTNDLHMATNTWEIGNRQLHKETSNAWNLGCAQAPSGDVVGPKLVDSSHLPRILSARVGLRMPF